LGAVCGSLPGQREDYRELRLCRAVNGGDFAGVRGVALSAHDAQMERAPDGVRCPRGKCIRAPELPARVGGQGVGVTTGVKLNREICEICETGTRQGNDWQGNGGRTVSVKDEGRRMKVGGKGPRTRANGPLAGGFNNGWEKDGRGSHARSRRGSLRAGVFRDFGG